MEALSIVKTGEAIRVILLSSGPMAVHLIEGLLKYRDAVHIVGILPATNTQRHRKMIDQPAEKELFQLARDNRLTLLDATSVNSPDFVQALDELQPHVVLVGGWSEIIKPPVIGFRNLHIINCHGSLLPKYRGTNPYMATVFYGDRQTACTFHLIDEGIDTGDILFQSPLEVGERETTVGLFHRIATQFGETVGPLFDDIAKGKILPRRQEGTVSYVPACQVAWGWIPWEMSPEVIDRRIRAIKGALPLVTSLNNTVVGFESGAVVNNNDRRQTTARQARRLRLPFRPGTIIANKADRIVVATRDPCYNVELDKPCIIPPGQLNPIDEFSIGAQFLSIECHDILKVA